MKRAKLKFKIWVSLALRIVVFGLVVTKLSTVGVSSLEQGIIEGENPVYDLVGDLIRVYLFTSRVVWDCSPKWEINFF